MQKATIEGIRLAPQQKDLWLLQRDEKKQPYRVQCAIEIEGNLNKAIFKTALENVVNRQEILRTTFECIPGMDIPVQVITNGGLDWLSEHNFSDVNPELQKAKIEEIFHQVSQMPFNFEEGPLFQVLLITLSPEKFVLIISLPAMLADTATLKNLMGEISRCYAASRRGEELDDDLLQYADIAQWQNELLEGEETEIGREYWRKSDIDRILNLNLPLENRPEVKPEFQPQSLRLTIKNDSLATNPTFLLTCWHVLLWRITEQSEIAIATACDGRKYEELEPAIGLFAKYLPLKIHLENRCKFSEILDQVNESLGEVYKWQESFSWEQLVGNNSEENHANFFPFCFDFETDIAKHTAGEVSFSIFKHYACITRFKVKLSCIQKQDGLDVEFHYDANLFEAEYIKGLARQFETLFHSAIAHPEASIDELEILDCQELNRVIIEFNSTKIDYPKSQCIHHIFEEQVKQKPDKIAVVFAGQQLTYTELNDRANQLANYLQKLGVKPEVFVGLCVERSLEMVIGILGILKAGGAYVPLDPLYPKERLSFMLEDTQTPILLTQQRLVESLPESNANIICLDTEWEAIAQQSRENPANNNAAENLAYLIYTSGSTGKPKGVLVTHQNLVHSTYARINYYQEPVTSFLLLSSFAFDSSVAGIFWTLCSGGILFLPQDGLQKDISQLIELLERNPISHLLSLPSLYALLLEQAAPEQLNSLRTVIVAGEPCKRELVARHLKMLTKTSLFNEYGPTEATVWSSVYNCQSLEAGRAQFPIGRPISNTQIYILDSDLRPVPIGVSGELYISGDGLARGYLNRPDLTGEKFIPNPFYPSDRLYKTGDLARYLLDGNIEFLGRIDQQVKIRGFRIELGEIEAVLSQHPAIREVVILARSDESDNKRLVAYIVHNEQIINPKSSELREFLQEKLPEYMVPSVFIRLKALPLMPNGKVDIKKLPAPETVRSELSETFVAPNAPIEKILAEIWAEVLQIDRVGIHDNFFELGGDSILSIQIVAKANKAGLQIAPKQIFAHQTIAELAAVVSTIRTIQGEQGLVTGTLPLTPIQHWFFELNQPDTHHWNQALLLELRQVCDPKLLEKVVQHLIEHHDALRLRFRQNKSSWEQISVSPNEVVPFTCFDFSALPEIEQKAAIEAAANQLQVSLNLSEGPLVRVALFDLGSQKTNRLLIVIHHLVVDGVSWRILLEDFQTIYEQLCRGEAIQLPPKTTSFKQWALRLQEYAQSAALQQERNYWLEQERSHVSRLPVDYCGGENAIATANTISVSLNHKQTQLLLQQVPKTFNTQINDVLLAALLQAFAEWTKQPFLLVDLEGHGREEIFDDVDLSRTVGWFTTIFPVLLKLEKTTDTSAVLNAVKQQLRNIPNRGIGYGVLRYLSQDLQTLPQAEVLFNYLGQSDQIFHQASLFAPAQESSGLTHSLRETRRYLLDINAIVVSGQLEISWTYSKAIHRQATIDKLAESFIKKLEMLISCSQSFSTEDNTNNTELIATLNADSILDPTICPPNIPIEPKTEPSAIFLTGATGFVGAFLLHELLQQTTADIYCLVRASNIEAAKKRLQSHLESYLLWNESFSHRIIPVVGDLSQPLLGLSDRQFEVLANEIDVIYHNGAFINLVYPYSVVKAANVLGTQEILRLASLVKVKPVHFMSTLSVFESVDRSLVEKIPEVNNLDNIPVPEIGYVQSKWVAEKLVTTARERGIPIAIYRLGRMSGNSKTGISNTDDFIHRVLKGCIELGSTPDSDTMVDMTPVDFVSQAIAHLSMQKESLGKAFHLFNPNPIPWRELVSWMRSFGYNIQHLSYNNWESMLMDKWQRKTLDETEFNAKSALHSLVLLLVKNTNDSNSNLPEPQIDCQNTLNGLANTSIVCPAIDDKLLRTYFSYLIQSGFLNSPQPEST